MHDSKLRSRLKAQLTKYVQQLTAGLSRPHQKFVGQMLFGIQAAQDVKLSNIARSLSEAIPLIKTEDRLSRNLKAAELEGALTTQLAGMGAARVEANTVLCLDLSDIRKPYAEKMEHLAPVHDGSTGEVGRGYWLCDVVAAETDGARIVPLYQSLYSAEAAEFTSENDEILGAIEQVRRYTQGRGIWAMDRGGDRKKLLEPLLDKGERFVIRATGKRLVTTGRHRVESLAALACRCALPHSAHILKIHAGRESRLTIRFGVAALRLPGRAERLHLVVVAGFGKTPLLLLTNVLGRAPHSQNLWWIVQIYLTRWKIEETFRFVKQSYNLEDIRVLTYQRLKNLVLLVAAAAYFAATFLGHKIKLRLLCQQLLIISRRFFGVPPFQFYALADAIRRLLSRSTPNPLPTPLASPQLELAFPAPP